MYQYKAMVVSVYDGDTITADIDLGFYTVLRKQKIRLYGINTPEIRTKDATEKKLGLIARDTLRELVLNKEVVLTTYKDKRGKYGRWLCSIDLDGIDINQELVKLGLAKEATY